MKSLEIEFPTPRVNVNELSFSQQSTEWTVYLGTAVNPEEQLQQLYEGIIATEVVNDDGSLHYPIVPNSIVDDRIGGEHGTAVTFPLAPLILDLIQDDPTLANKYIQDGALKWKAFLEVIQSSEGVVIPYHLYGVEGADSTIVIKLEKEIAQGEETDLINHSPHDTTVVNGTDGEGHSVPVEKYVLTVEYNPDYDHVLPAGQGGHGHHDYHTGTYGSMYQGHAAGRETSANEHVINVFAKKLQLNKVNQSHDPITDSTAEFALYREATADEMADSSVEKVSVEGLQGSYILVQSLTTTNGVVTTDLLPLPEDNKPYYLVETKAPIGYNRLIDPLKVTIDMDGHNTWTKISDGSTSQTKPNSYVLSDWLQEATIKVTDKNGEGTSYAIREGTIVYDHTNDTTDASVVYKIMNDAGVKLPDSGGPGTTWIYLLGCFLFIGCGILLAARRRLLR